MIKQAYVPHFMLMLAIKSILLISAQQCYLKALDFGLNLCSFITHVDFGTSIQTQQAVIQRSVCTTTGTEQLDAQRNDERNDKQHDKY